MTSTAPVETSSTFPAAPDRSRLLDAFFSGRNERTLAAYRAGLGDFSAFAGTVTAGEAANGLLSGSLTRGSPY